MPTPQSKQQQDADVPEAADLQLPSEGVRSVITLLVFIHLFILFASAFASTQVSSDLFRGLFNAPGFSQYMGLLHMGSYSFHLTHDSDFDKDHNCEIVLDWRGDLAEDSDEFRALKKIELYDEQGTFPPTRRRRFQRLAYFAAENTGDPVSESRLPLAIARHLLAEQKVDKGHHRFRLRQQDIRLPKFFLNEQPSPEDPYDESLYSNIYQADVTFFKGKARISKISQSRETAPVDRPRGRDRSPLNRTDTRSNRQQPINTNRLPNGNRN